MTSKSDSLQILLAGLRAQFLGELSERCDHIDKLILSLVKSPDNREVYDELYRHVHSLKGSGGTHGLAIISTICHQLENFLTESHSNLRFDNNFSEQALAHVDLLRQVEGQAHTEQADYSAIESELQSLYQSTQLARNSGIIVESSTIMSELYQKALADVPLKLTVIDNGLKGLERLLRESFDILIVGRELRDLNGIALMAALRSSQAANQDIPAVLVSSKRDLVPDHVRCSAVIEKNQELAKNLSHVVSAVLKGK